MIEQCTFCSEQKEIKESYGTAKCCADCYKLTAGQYIRWSVGCFCKHSWRKPQPIMYQWCERCHRSEPVQPAYVEIDGQ